MLVRKAPKNVCLGDPRKKRGGRGERVEVVCRRIFGHVGYVIGEKKGLGYSAREKGVDQKVLGQKSS